MVNEYAIRRHFADYLADCLNERSIHPWYAAYYSESSEATFRKCLKGAKLPAPLTLIMTAELFECSVNDLLGYEPVDIPVRDRLFDSGRDRKQVIKRMAEQISRRMEEHNLDVEELARLSGVGVYSINNQLGCYTLLDTYSIVHICEALNCTPSELLGY